MATRFALYVHMRVYKLRRLYYSIYAHNDDRVQVFVLEAI